MMFTDWTMTDPKYFYLRGMIFGAVGFVVLMYFVCVIIEFAQKKGWMK